MRISGIIAVLVIILALSACVLEHSPVSPAMTFLIGSAYTPAGDTLDTLATIRIGFTATKGNSNMAFMQVARAVDTLPSVVLDSYVLTDSQNTVINRNFSFTSGVYPSTATETYTVKISDAAGFTFTKSIAFIIKPH